MGHKTVCLTCRKAFSRPSNSAPEQEYRCPDCGQHMHSYPHRFRPPKKEDDAGWETVKYLFEHGFNYQHVYKEFGWRHDRRENYVQYPNNLRDAKEFVEKYSDQANQRLK